MTEPQEPGSDTNQTLQPVGSYVSPTLMQLPSNRRPKPSTICERCRASVWFASLGRATGAHTVVAFNAGNLEAVAKIMRERYPDRPIVIAADNDLGLEAKGKPNVGSQKAEKAAAAVAGHVAMPEGKGDGKSVDWNDIDKSQGNQSVKKAMFEAIAIADRKMIADAKYTGHDASRAAEVATMHQADMQRAASGDKSLSEPSKQQINAAFSQLKDKAEKVAETQQDGDEGAEKPATKSKAPKRTKQKAARSAGAEAGY